MENSKILLFKIGYVLLLFASAIMIIFYRLLFSCDNQEWYVFVLLILSFIIFPFSLYNTLKEFNVEYSRWFWTGVISLALYLFAFHKGNDIALKEIKENGGVVKIAVVHKLHSSIQSAESVHFSYLAEGKSIRSHHNCRKQDYNKLAVGDTILIVYSLRCPDWNLPFNYFPSSKEIKQCEQGCLLKNGELLVFD